MYPLNSQHLHLQHVIGSPGGRLEGMTSSDRAASPHSGSGMPGTNLNVILLYQGMQHTLAQRLHSHAGAKRESAICMDVSVIIERNVSSQAQMCEIDCKLDSQSGSRRTI